MTLMDFYNWNIKSSPFSLWILRCYLILVIMIDYSTMTISRCQIAQGYFPCRSHLSSFRTLTAIHSKVRRFMYTVRASIVGKYMTPGAKLVETYGIVGHGLLDRAIGISGVSWGRPSLLCKCLASHVQWQATSKCVRNSYFSSFSSGLLALHGIMM